MLPKRQPKNMEQGPPKYQPPPQVTKPLHSNNGVAFNGNKDANHPMDSRKGPQQTSNENKRSGPAPQHPVPNEGNDLHAPKDNRALSPTRNIVRPQEDNLIIRNSRLNGEDPRPAWRPLTDEELLQRSQHDLIRILRSAEAEINRLATEQGHIVRDARSRLQNSTAELRSAQELVRRLQDDNQELRDLCCFLDDDRQKGRKLAREWQRFGRYTASVMRQEVSAYQGKLRELDNRQHELIRDNLELKELCLYLDEERGNHGSCASCGASLRPGTRDDGDGSSSSTNADEPPIQAPQPASSTNFIQRSESRDRIMEDSIVRQRNAFNDQLVGYIRSLEQRVTQLEEERRVLQQRLLHGSGHDPNASGLRPPGPPSTDSSTRPEAVVHALQVLQVREQLERSMPPPVPAIAPICIPPAPTSNINTPVLSELASVASGGQAELDDGEKALVREMCNVVWRKLEEAPPSARH